MLVLTRRVGEWISIGENVTVRVLSVKGDTIQLGVDAPREIPVHRGEIFEQIRAETEAARRSAADPAALARLASGAKRTSTPDK
jgi:carbon storage regulator